jgi:hypothetical protein
MIPLTIVENIETNRLKECITYDCKNMVHLHSYWRVCIDCYSSVPDHIPTEQINLYIELRQKENYEITNDS